MSETGFSQSVHDYTELVVKSSQLPFAGSKQRPINQFRAKVRWLIEYRPLLEEDPDEMTLNIYGDVVVSKKVKSTFLSLKEKLILLKPANERTPEEIKQLHLVVSGLKCFRRYPEDVRKKLSEVTYLVCYTADRVIIRQGRPGNAMYFIIDGEVVVSTERIDELTGKAVSTMAGLLRAGDMFGEVSLLHDVPRTATIVSTTPVQLLMLRRKDFSDVLEKTLKADWDKVQQAMSLFPYFNNWSHVAVRECCMLSRIASFAPNETILGDGEGNTKHVYFILRGKCQVIQHLNMAVYKENGKVYCRLIKAGYELTKGERVETHFMQVCLLGKLQCFGLGENMVNRRIVAVTEVDCLVCPRYWMMVNNQAKIWSRVLRYMNSMYPTTTQLFSEFVKNRRWIIHRQKLAGQFSGKVPVSTNIHDVPRSVRVRDYIVGITEEQTGPRRDASIKEKCRTGTQGKKVVRFKD